MNRTVISITALLVLHVAVLSPAWAETAYDGHFWTASSLQVKRFYVQGVMSGILLGQDRLVRYGLPDRGRAPLSPECHRAVVGVANALERQIDHWDRNRLVDALDDFYGRPENRALGLQWAVMTVMSQMHGAPQDGIPP